MAMSSQNQVRDLSWDNGLIMQVGSNTWRLSALDGDRSDSARVTDSKWCGPCVTMRLSKGGHRLTPRLELYVGRKMEWSTRSGPKPGAVHGSESQPSPLFRYALSISISDHKMLRRFCSVEWDVLPWLRLIAISPNLLTSLYDAHGNLARLCASRLAMIEPALLAHGSATPKHRLVTEWLGLSDAPWVGNVIQKLNLLGVSPQVLSRLVDALGACVAVREHAKVLKHAKGLCAESVLALAHTSPWLSLSLDFLRQITSLRGPDRRRLANQQIPVVEAGARATGKPERFESVAQLQERSEEGWERRLSRRGKRRLFAQEPASPAEQRELFVGSIQPLLTAGALKREGAQMRHCLGENSHMVNLYNGTSRFYAIDGPQRGTLQVHIDRHGLPHARQLHGVENQEIGPDMRDQIERWLADSREAARGKANAKRLRELAVTSAQVEPWFDALLDMPVLRTLRLIVSPSHASAFPWKLGPHHVRRVDCISSRLSRLTLQTPAISYDPVLEQPRLARIAEDMELSFGLYGKAANRRKRDNRQMFDDEGREDRLASAIRGFDFELDWAGRRVTPKDSFCCSDAQVAGLFTILNCFDPDWDLTVNLSHCEHLVGTFWEEAWSRRPWSLNLTGCINLDRRRISDVAVNSLKQATQTAESRRSSRATLDFSGCPGLDCAVLDRLVGTGGVGQIHLPDWLAAEASSLGPLLTTGAANGCGVGISAEKFASEVLDFSVGSQLDLTLFGGTLDEQAMGRIAGAVQCLMLWNVTVSPAGWRRLAGGTVTHLYIYHVDAPPDAEQWMAVAECRQLEILVIKAITT